MRSAASPQLDPDRTARARIRDAAIARFAADGVDGTSLRTIAADAGVSPALVVHHFGSKDGLRVACDQHVAAVVREQKRDAAAHPGADPLAALRGYREGPDLLRYLARTLIDGSPHVAELVDEMVADAVEYTELSVANGTMKPTEDPRARAAVLTIWSLGALVLHEHVQRLLGADLTGDPAQMAPYLLAGGEILTNGVIEADYFERVKDAFQQLREEGS